MQKVTGDPAAMVAAALTQAEMALRAEGAVDDSMSSRLARRFEDHRGTVVAAYEYYLTLVTTGEHVSTEAFKPDERDS